MKTGHLKRHHKDKSVSEAALEIYIRPERPFDPLWRTSRLMQFHPNGQKLKNWPLKKKIPVMNSLRLRSVHSEIMLYDI